MRRVLLLLLAILLPGGSAGAKCLPIAAAPPRLILAAAAEPGTIRLSFLGHSSSLIVTPERVTAITDYFGFPTPTAPDVVTMNNAHETHYTSFVPPEVSLVLRG